MLENLDAIAQAFKPARRPEERIAITPPLNAFRIDTITPLKLLALDFDADTQESRYIAIEPKGIAIAHVIPATNVTLDEGTALQMMALRHKASKQRHVQQRQCDEAIRMVRDL